MASEYGSMERIQRLLGDGFDVEEIDTTHDAVVVDLAKGPLRQRVAIGRDEVARYLNLPQERPHGHVALMA